MPFLRPVWSQVAKVCSLSNRYFSVFPVRISGNTEMRKNIGWQSFPLLNPVRVQAPDMVNTVNNKQQSITSFFH